MGLLLYGERGIVNALVLDIHNNIQLIRQVLGAVKLGDGRGFDWLDKIKEVDFWIEPSFGQFGNPDLIAICRNERNEKYVVFFEAKIVRYEDSAVPLAAQFFQGINSRVNAQLTLKYRFVQALTNSRNKGGIIKETPNMTHAYAQLHMDDKQKDHRKLANSYVVSFCKAMQQNCKGVFYIALTADDITAAIDRFPSELLPAVFDDHANDIWDIEKSKFGILTYGQIEKILPTHGMFAATKKVVIPDFKPASVAMGVQKLRTKNWKEFSAATKELGAIMHRLIMDTAIELYDANQQIIKHYKYAGSDSYKGPGGNTIIKIIPYKTQTGESIFITVKDSIVRAAEAVDYFNQGPFRVGVGVNARTFYGRSFDPGITQEELDKCSSYLYNALSIG